MKETFWDSFWDFVLPADFKIYYVVMFGSIFSTLILGKFPGGYCWIGFFFGLLLNMVFGFFKFYNKDDVLDFRRIEPWRDNLIYICFYFLSCSPLLFIRWLIWHRLLW